jgi:hypothetical protein
MPSASSNHPFVDGNKRTGFTVAILFLELNGQRFTAPEADATVQTLGLAAGEISEARYAEWLKANTVRRSPATVSRMRNTPPAGHRAAWAVVLCLALGGLIDAPIGAIVDQGANASRQKTGAATVNFNGTEFFHRFSQAAQHEFTPKGDEDLSAWTEMMTVNVHDGARTGDGLAEVANRVVGNYEANGHIMRTLSKPRTATAEAEHFVAAVLQAPNVFEVAFARFLLFEGRGVVAVYSRRFYGANAQEEMTTWFKANAIKIENVLVSWNGIPSLKVLKGLPQSR